MDWVKLKTALAFDARVVTVGNEAFGGWARMLSWAGDYETDGRVPVCVANALAGSKEALARLVGAGLLELAEALPSREPGHYLISDYQNDQTTVAELEALSAKRREAGRLGGLSKASKRHRNAVAKPKQTKSKKRNPPTPQTGGNDGFEAFWSTYPRRAGKGSKVKARAIWTALSPADRDQATSDLAARIASHPEWQSPRESGRFLPMVTTFLRGRLWEDDWGQEPATAPEAPAEADWTCRDCDRTYSAAEARALGRCPACRGGLMGPEAA